MRKRAAQGRVLLASATAAACLLLCGPVAFADDATPTADEPTAVERGTDAAGSAGDSSGASAAQDAATTGMASGSAETGSPDVSGGGSAPSEPAPAAPAAPAQPDPQPAAPEEAPPAPAQPAEPQAGDATPSAEADAADPAAPATITATAPEFSDTDLTVTIPQMDAVSYLIDDVVTEPGTHPAEGTIVVTAVVADDAATGDAATGDAATLTGDTRWEHTYPAATTDPATDEQPATGDMAESATASGAPALTAQSTSGANPYDDDGWAFEEGSDGHLEYTENGLNVWTGGTAAGDKVAGWRTLDTPIPLDSLTTDPTMTQINNSGGGLAGLQLVVTACGKTGNLVSEPESYGTDNWWSTTAFFSGHGGGGYAYLGTLADFVVGCPDATVTGVGFSLGSGVEGNVTIQNITIGDLEFTFGFAEMTTSYAPQALPGVCLAGGRAGPMRVAAPANLPEGASFEVSDAGGDAGLLEAGETAEFSSYEPVDWVLNYPGYTLDEGVATEGTVPAASAPNCEVPAAPQHPSAPQLLTPTTGEGAIATATPVVASAAELPATGAENTGAMAATALVLMATGIGLVLIVRRHART